MKASFLMTPVIDHKKTDIIFLSFSIKTVKAPSNSHL